MRRLKRDGVALCYKEVDEDEPPVLLVHGWCCDHTYFAPQFEYFAKHDHRVVVVDLRGHGRSDKPQQHYTMQAFADDLVWMCGQIGLKKPAVVGHSMGGIVAFDLAARYPERTAAVVIMLYGPWCCPRGPGLPSRVFSRSCAARVTRRCCASMCG
jgi:pimeloyl-ACP methyl ester carboxylesterase